MRAKAEGEKLSMVAERGSSMDMKDTSTKGFEQLVLGADSDWSTFRESLLRHCRIGVFTSDVSKKEIFVKSKRLVGVLNQKEDTGTVEDLATVTEVSALMTEDGIKEAGEFILLLIMEKATEEIRTIIRDCGGEDLLEMWKKFSNTLVRTRGVDYVARIYEYP